MSLADAYADAHLGMESFDSDVSQLDAVLVQAVERWERLLSLSGAVSLDTGGATTEIESAIQTWNALLEQGVAGTVDLDTDGATDDLTAAILAWQAATSTPITARLDLDTSEATDEALATLGALESIAATGVTVNVDLDTDGATDALATSIVEWRAALDSAVVANVDMDTAGATAHLEAAVIEWERMAAFTAKAKFEVDDPESLANIATTFAGIRPLTDIPIRFHIDGGSVQDVTRDLQILAEAWERALDLSVRPTTRPTGDNDLPSRPGDPARPRGPPSDGPDPIITPQVNPEPALAETRGLKSLVEDLLKVVMPVGMDEAKLLAQAEALQPLVEAAIDATAKVGIDKDGVVRQAEALDALLDEVVKITLGVDGSKATAETRAIRETLQRSLRALVLNMTVDGAGAGVEALGIREAVERALGHIPADVDLDTTEATGHAVAWHESMKRLVGKLPVNVDLDAGMAAAEGFLAKTLVKVDQIGSSLFGWIDKASQDGGKLSFSFGSMFSGLAEGGGKVLPILAKILAIFAAIAAGLPLLIGGLSALVAAAGGLVGLAAGFTTLAVSIGGAAAAAGVLGIALNKDLAERAKEGLTSLKNAVAAATRGLGTELLDRFQGPFVNSISRIAASAAKLGDAIFPVLDAVLGWLDEFNAVLQTSDAREFVDGLSSAIVGFINLFRDYLAEYLSLVNDVMGQTSGIRDFVTAILDLGLQAGPLFIAVGNFVSEFSKGIAAIGDIALPLVTKLVDTLTMIGTSDPFQQMVRGGIAMWSLLLDIIQQIGAGIQRIGIDRAMKAIVGAFDRLVESDFGGKVGEIFATIMNVGAQAIDMLSEFLSSDFFASIVDFFNEALPLVVEFFQELGTGIGEGLGNMTIFNTSLKVIISILQTLVAVAEPVGVAIGALVDVILMLFNALYTGGVVLGGAIMSGLTTIAGTIIEIVEFAGKAIDYLTPGEGSNRLTDWAAEASDAIWEFERNGVMATGKYVEGLWSAGDSVEEFGQKVTSAFGSGGAMDDAVTRANKFADVLGEGATQLGEYGKRMGLTSLQIDAAGNAAADAAAQFESTTGLIDAMREAAAKPIKLNLDFEKTKLDLNSLVTYVEAKMETVKTTVNDGLVVDPGADTLASQVVGADGSTLNDVSSQAAEKFVPAHLEQTIAESINQMYDNVLRDVDNEEFLREMERNGFGALADQLRTLDGPKLELAIQELGDATSNAVRVNNQKILDAQAALDTEFNPFQTAIDEAKKAAIYQVRQAEIVRDLESQGMSDFAKQIASLKPEDLEAAIRTYDSMSPEMIAGMEQQLDAIATALEESAARIDPLGRMFTSVANTPGARAGLAGQLLTPEQIAIATGKTQGDEDIRNQLTQFFNTFTRDGKHFSTEDVNRMVNEAIAQLASGESPNLPGMIGDVDQPNGKDWAARRSAAITEAYRNRLTGDQAGFQAFIDKVNSYLTVDLSTLSDEERRNAQRWRDIISGYDSATGLPIGESPGFAPVTNEEATVATAIAVGQQNQVTPENAGQAIVQTVTEALGDPATTKTIADGLVTDLSAAIPLAVEDRADSFDRSAQAIIDGLATALNGADLADSIVEAFIDKVAAGVTDNTQAGDIADRFMADFSEEMTQATKRHEVGFTHVGEQVVSWILGEFNADASEGIPESTDQFAQTLALFSVTAMDNYAGGFRTAGRTAVDHILDGMEAGANEKAQENADTIAGIINAAITLALSAPITGSFGGDPAEGGGAGGAVGRAAQSAVGSAAEAARRASALPGFQIGEALMDGIILGMQSRLPDLIAAATAISNVIALVMRTALKVKSPSQVTMTIGEQIAEGLAAGLDAGHERVLTSARGLADHVTNSLSGLSAEAQLSLSANADAIRPNVPPAATMDRPSAMLEALRDYQNLATANTAAAVAAAPTGAPAAPAPAVSERALIHADTLNINGVRDADSLPEQTSTEMWRIGFGEGPRRRNP